VRRPWFSQKVEIPLEAGWWMMRPFFYSTPVLLAAAGWFAGAKPGAAWHIAAIGALAGLLRGCIAIVNDVLDRNADAITAPTLPIPSGLISVQQALLFLVIQLAIALAAGYLGLGSLPRLGLVAFVFFLVVVCTVIYSLTKRLGALALIFSSPLMVAAATAGWIGAGEGDVAAFTLVAVCAGLYGLNAQLIAALRDVDKDPAAGNRTVAVRYGAVNVFWFSCLVSTAEVAVVTVAGIVHGSWLFVIPMSFGIMTGGRSVFPTIKDFKRRDLGRDQRTAALAAYTKAHFWILVALIMTRSPWGGIVVGGTVFCLNSAHAWGYRRRMTEGRLAAKRSVLASGAA
jgi:4-hydroxybenzoate polyprenyltransferase